MSFNISNGNIATLTGTLGVADGGTGTATAFTAGSVVVAGASGVYTQDNTGLFYDTTNHRLGIGTITPGYPLHVQINGASSATSVGTTSNTLVLENGTTNGTNAIEFLTKGSSSNAYKILFTTGSAGANGSIQYTLAAQDNMTFLTDNAERARITNTGFHVGGSAANPATALDVTGVITVSSTTGSIDLSTISAGNSVLKITKTNATPSTTYTAHVASTDPAGYLQILDGASVRYIPFYT